MNNIENLYELLISLNCSPTIKIASSVGPTINVNIWIKTKVFFKIELYYFNNIISPVHLIGNNLKIELLTCNINSIKSILLVDYKFRLENRTYVSIVISDKLLDSHSYVDTHPEDYTLYQPIEFDIEYQKKVMSLILQKNDAGELMLFKITSKKELSLIHNLHQHPIFNLFDICDSKSYLIKSSNPNKKIVYMMNQRYLNFNPSQEYQDQISMLINIINNIVTNKTNKKISVSEIVMNSMYYLNIKFNEKIYYIIFEPKHNETLKVYINDYIFNISLNTIRINEVYKLLYDLISVIDLKCTINPEKSSGEREYEEYEKKQEVTNSSFTEIKEESWFEYLTRPLRFSLF